MKSLYKTGLRVLCLLTFFVTATHAQETGGWQLGLGAGYTNYYGDLSNYHIKGLNNVHRFAGFNKYYNNQPSYSVIFQKKLTPTLGLIIQGNYLQFGMSDRYRNNNGSFDTASVNYARSLNFRTKMQDAGLAFSFSPNNGIIGSKAAFFYPSFFIGAGVSRFTVKGDLYDENGNPYNYRLPGNISDGDYETKLRDLRTETDNKVRNVEPYVDLGLALNFRFNQYLTLSVQSDIKYSASDYLDDVSGKYKASYPTAAEAYAARPGYNVVDPVTQRRGNEDGVNDFYINNRIVLNIGLGKKKPAQKKFSPPVIYSLNNSYNHAIYSQDSVKKKMVVNQDSLLRLRADSLIKVIKDSTIRDSIARAGYPPVRNDSLTRQLNTINDELKEIRAILSDQQYRPREQQLLYQADSIKTLRNRILSKPVISREEYLRLRIYDLQADSLRNEMNRLPKPLNRRTTIADSSVIGITPYYDQPVNQVENRLPENQPESVVVVADSTAFLNPEILSSEIIVMKQDERYQKETRYRKQVDSLERLINWAQQTSREQADASKDPALQKNVDSLERRLNTLQDSVAKADTAQEAFERTQLLRLKQMNEDSIANLENRLQRANDSAVYYKNRLSERPVMKTDTVAKKRWYQKIFSNKKKKTAAVTSQVEDTVYYASRQRYYDNETNALRERLKEHENDSVAAATVTQDKEALAERQLRQMQNQVKSNADSLKLMQDQLNRSKDSAAYYRNENQTAGADNRLEKEQKAKWYKNLFASKKAMNKRNETTVVRRDQYAQQQQYYDNEAIRLQQSMEEINRRNQDLERESRYLNNYNKGDRRSTSTQPVVVVDRNNPSGYTNSNYNEIASLRAEIDRLRVQMQRPDQNLTITERPLLAPVPPVGSLDTTRVIQFDTSGVQSLRSELLAIRNQLDSLRNKPAPVEKAAVPEKKFDVSGFPVISVYFNLGSTVLSNDQLNKLTPLAQVAAKNKDAVIVLHGFTDAVGNPVTNEVIARKRTEYVKNQLIRKFPINANRIQLEDPSISNTEKGKKANPLDRRVDLMFRSE